MAQAASTCRVTLATELHSDLSPTNPRPSFRFGLPAVAPPLAATAVRPVRKIAYRSGAYEHNAKSAKNQQYPVNMSKQGLAGRRPQAAALRSRLRGGLFRHAPCIGAMLHAGRGWSCDVFCDPLRVCVGRAISAKSAGPGHAPLGHRGTPVQAPSQQPVKIGAARCRGVFAQSGAARRTGRTRARGLSQAARTGPRRPRVRRRSHRGRQDARPRRRILARRPAAHASNCSAGWARPISTCGRRRRSGSPARTRPRSPRPAPNDKRFADPEWTSNQFFDFLKQAYLLTTRWANQLVATPPTSIRTPGRRPNSTCGRSPTRSRRRTSF